VATGDGCSRWLRCPFTVSKGWEAKIIWLGLLLVCGGDGR